MLQWRVAHKRPAPGRASFIPRCWETVTWRWIYSQCSLPDRRREPDRAGCLLCYLLVGVDGLAAGASVSLFPSVLKNALEMFLSRVWLEPASKDLTLSGATGRTWGAGHVGVTPGFRKLCWSGKGLFWGKMSWMKPNVPYCMCMPQYGLLFLLYGGQKLEKIANALILNVMPSVWRGCPHTVNILCIFIFFFFRILH